MPYYCDNCGEVLGATAYACRGYTYITCSYRCMAGIMLDMHQVDTVKFMIEERDD